MSLIRALLADEGGAVLTEYGILMASLAILMMAGLLIVSNSANALLGNIFASTTNMELCPPGTPNC
jgi:Flp pilus assembly pilin Flp